MAGTSTYIKRIHDQNCKYFEVDDFWTSEELHTVYTTRTDEVWWGPFNCFHGTRTERFFRLKFSWKYDSIKYTVVLNPIIKRKVDYVKFLWWKNKRKKIVTHYLDKERIRKDLYSIITKKK